MDLCVYFCLFEWGYLMLDFLKRSTIFDKDIKPYVLGFVLSLILTVIPFILVINHIISSYLNYLIILICAVIQIFVHFFYFFHLNCSKHNIWNVIILLFILIIIFIIVFGSIWIMYNLNHHMIMN